MLSLGDVLAVVGLVLGVGISSWALVIAMSLLFEDRSKHAARTIQESPWKTGLIGLAFHASLGTIGFVLLSVPNPGAKLAGSLVLLALIMVTTVGVAGLVGLAARRIRQLDPNMSAYGALSRATTCVVIPCMLPLVGWLLLGPVVLCLGLGAGMRAMRQPQVAPPIPGAGAA